MPKKEEDDYSKGTKQSPGYESSSGNKTMFMKEEDKKWCECCHCNCCLKKKKETLPCTMGIAQTKKQKDQTKKSVVPFINNLSNMLMEHLATE